MIWSLRRIETIRLLAQTHSVTETARLLSVTQPAVSQSLKEIEDYTGLKFFFRIGNRIRMTPEGAAMLPLLDRILDDVGRLDGRIEELKDATSGHIGIATMPPLASGLLASAVTGFSSRRPSVTFTLEAHTSTEILRHIRQERADIGFTLKVNDDIGVLLEPLLQTEPVAIVPSGHRLADHSHINASDLTNETIVAHAPETPLGMMVREATGSQLFRENRIINTNQAMAAAAMSRAGGLIAVTHPLNLELLSVSDVRLIPFRPATPLLVMMVMSRARPVSRLLSQFVSHLRKEAESVSALYAEQGIVFKTM